jgi:hypothetical protein
MTHNELLDAIDRQIITAPPFALGGYTMFLQALRAVVELHIPYGIDKYPELQSYCLHCDHLQSEVWPCPTIQAIEKELS